MMPVSTSTFSDWTSLSARPTAMSGLRWSSSITVSIMSLPLVASKKPSRTSMPRPAPPPERVVIIPTLTLPPCPSASPAVAAAATQTASAIMFLMRISLSLIAPRVFAPVFWPQQALIPSSPVKPIGQK